MGRKPLQTLCKRFLGYTATACLLWSSTPGLAQNATVSIRTKPVGKPAILPKTYAAGEIVLEKSRVYILVGKSGLGHEHGVMGQLKEGTIHLSESIKGDRIVFDMPSFDADSSEARKYVGLEGTTAASTRSQVNANMLGDTVLDVKKFPTATFQIKSVTRLREQTKRNVVQHQIEGNFTLHGMTKPVTVIAGAEDQGDMTHLRGSFSVLQSEYGITPFSKGFGLIGVADRLQITGDFWITNSR